jgi:anti-repressor protein
MNDLKIFKNEEFGNLRAAEMNGEPWFVGKDVAEALGYSNTKDAISTHVDKEDKSIFQRSDFATLENYIPKSAFPVKFVPADIPNRGLTFINESGLYSLILSSKLPSAKRFKHWVTSEVLPAIRKHGAYMTDEKAFDVVHNASGLADLLRQAADQLKQKDLQIERMRPKEIFSDAVSASHTDILIGELAKILKGNGIEIGQNRLFTWLRENGYLIRRKGTDYNMPTQKSMENGLFRIKETAITHSDGHVSVSKTPKVTGSGQVYFVNKFLKMKARGEIA